MGKYWYKIVPVADKTYKFKVIEYYGTDKLYTCRTLKYFRDRRSAERYLEHLREYMIMRNEVVKELKKAFEG